MADSKRQKLTGLYVYQNDDGSTSMSGKTQDGKHRYTIYQNGFKEEGDNKPPFILYVQELDGQPTGSVDFNFNPTPKQKPADTFKNDDSF